jgi:hypothetical protein
MAKRAAGRSESEGARRVVLRLDRFAGAALEQESANLGVPVEELARFAVLYYLADLDSGRIARPIPPPQGRAADAAGG